MLVTTSSIHEYFREALSSALKKHNLELTDTAQAYLVHLMGTFARSENAFAGADPGEKPAMATLIARAQEVESDEAVRIYKHVGDSSLVMSGFFGESVESGLVSPEYYVSVGETAYNAVASMLRPTAATSSVLFAELAGRFEALVELLTAMSLHGERTTPNQTSDARVLELIERYQKTGKREVLDALAAQGVVLRPGLRDDDDLVH